MAETALENIAQNTTNQTEAPSQPTNKNNVEVPINPFRYNHIQNKMWDFKHGISDDRFDEPGEFYFKIFFYFGRGNDNGIIQNGLLGCNFDAVDDIIKNKRYKVNHFREAEVEAPMNANSAYYFLRLNGEEERAEKLKSFIYLLSDISTNKPWYFQSIDGLATAMERKMFSEGEVKVEEKRGNITIKCLEDSYDMRIGTLLDLYKDIAFSYIQKKEILPANMRKFDMGIYIFNRPTRQLISNDFKLGTKNYLQNYNKNMEPETTPFDNGTSAKLSADISRLRTQQNAENYYTSCKYIEFQNCEIGYNSGSTGYGAVSNVESFKTEYTITIEFDDVYEARYNEFVMRTIGDFVERDMYLDMNRPKISSENTDEKNVEIEKANKGIIGNPIYEERYFVNFKTDKEEPVRNPIPSPNSNIIGNMFSEVGGAFKNDLNVQVNHIAMGNLGEYGLGGLLGLANEIKQGDIFGVISNIKGLIGTLKGEEKESKPEITINNLGKAEPQDIEITNNSLGIAENISGEIETQTLNNSSYKEYNITKDYLGPTRYDPEEIARLRALNTARNLANSL